MSVTCRVHFTQWKVKTRH